MLGAGGDSAQGKSSIEPLGRREIMARAAEERMRKQKDAKASEQRAKDAATKQE